MKRRTDEEALHRLVAQYLDLLRLDWHHSPLGGYRRTREARRLHGMGARAGWPDIVVVTRPRHPDYVGVAIELKSGRNKPTAAQRDWLDRLARHGWLTAVCRSLDEVRSVIAQAYPGLDAGARA